LEDRVKRLALIGALLMASCTERSSYLLKVEPQRCKGCLEDIQKRAPSLKLLKSYRSVECLFLVELPPKEAERLKEFKECVRYIEPDRKLKLIE
jgi:hypothetical protein